MYCPQCGKQNQAGVRFCKNCGRSLTRASAPQPTSSPKPSLPTEPAPVSKQAKRLKKPSKTKLVLFLGAIVVVALIVLLIMGWENETVKTPPSSENFLTFSTYDGFTVQYPDWQIEDESSEVIGITKANECGMLLGVLSESYSDIQEMLDKMAEEAKKDKNAKLLRYNVSGQETTLEVSGKGNVLKGQSMLDVEPGTAYHFLFKIISLPGKESDHFGIYVMAVEDKWSSYYKEIAEYVISTVRLDSDLAGDLKEEDLPEPEVHPDVKRVSDIKQVQTALELYFMDAGHYPESVDFGRSLSYKGTVYMSVVPNNPAYEKDICQAYINHAYHQLDDGQSYEILFCLEQGVPSLSAGYYLATPQGIKAVTENKIKVKASSFLIDEKGKYDYAALNVLDGKSETGWVEGTDHDGIGQSLTFYFSIPQTISGCKIIPSYAENEEIYFWNNRLKEIVLQFDNGKRDEYILEDHFGEQQINFSPITTSQIKLIIKSVYPGSKHKDTSINEISFF